jgi:hypothetical protein
MKIIYVAIVNIPTIFLLIYKTEETVKKIVFHFIRYLVLASTYFFSFENKKNSNNVVGFPKTTNKIKITLSR